MDGEWTGRLRVLSKEGGALDVCLLSRSLIAPPNRSGVAGAAIQYEYDDDDRLTGSVVGAGEYVVIRLLSPAGNPEEQEERSAP